MTTISKPKSYISPGKKAIAHVKKILEDNDCDPFEGMVEIISKRTPNGNYFYDTSDRIVCLKELAQYVAPKLRSVEHKAGEDGTPLQFNIVNFGGIVNEGTGNNTQRIESGGHRSIQQPVHVHDKHTISANAVKEVDHSDSGSNSGGKSAGSSDEQQFHIHNYTRDDDKRK